MEFTNDHLETMMLSLAKEFKVRYFENRSANYDNEIIRFINSISDNFVNAGFVTDDVACMLRYRVMVAV